MDDGRSPRRGRYYPLGELKQQESAQQTDEKYPNQQERAPHHSNTRNTNDRAAANKIRGPLPRRRPSPPVKVENDESLPLWMQDYFHWHRTQLAQLNETNWLEHNYLVMRCLRTDFKCGGAADRLGPIPVALLLAAQSHRILFIQWERPAALEEFLVPPVAVGGITASTTSTILDWRIPDWLHGRLPFRKRPHIMTLHHAAEQLAESTCKILVDMLLQVNDHGAAYYNAHRPVLAKQKASTFQDVYPAVWNALFQPSPAVAQRIGQQMDHLGLTEGNYAAVHIRSLYLRNQTFQTRKFENAVNCASSLAPGLPILVATDSAAVTHYAVQYGQAQGGVSVVAAHVNAAAAAAKNNATLLHLDRGPDFLQTEITSAQIQQETTRPAADYYDVFVDLYLLSRSRCMAFCTGNFGRWARSTSRASSSQQQQQSSSACWINYGTARCQWTKETQLRAS